MCNPSGYYVADSDEDLDRSQTRSEKRQLSKFKFVVAQIRASLTNRTRPNSLDKFISPGVMQLAASPPGEPVVVVLQLARLAALCSLDALIHLDEMNE